MDARDCCRTQIPGGVCVCRNMENSLGCAGVPKLAFLLFGISLVAWDSQVTGKSLERLFFAPLLSWLLFRGRSRATWRDATDYCFSCRLLRVVLPMARGAGGVDVSSARDVVESWPKPHSEASSLQAL